MKGCGENRRGEPQTEPDERRMNDTSVNDERRNSHKKSEVVTSKTRNAALRSHSRSSYPSTVGAPARAGGEETGWAPT